MKRVFTVFRTIKNVVCWVLIVALVFVLIGFMSSRLSGKAPGLFGYSIYRVSSGSMVPELNIGDVILDKEIDSPESIKVGDVITFLGSGETEGMTVTHKVIVAPFKNDNGEWRVQTQGVANPEPDKEMSFDKVLSVKVCSLPLVSYVVNLFLSPWGLLVFLLLVILIFFDELVNIVKILSGHKEEKDRTEDINEIIDRLSKENQEKAKSEASDANE